MRAQMLNKKIIIEGENNWDGDNSRFVVEELLPRLNLCEKDKQTVLTPTPSPSTGFTHKKGSLLVGRAGFEPATARYLWPVQARVKPTVGRPLQRLHQLSRLAGSRALPG